MKEGLDPNKLQMESIEPSARIAMLATGKIPAIDFFIITKPAMERAVKDKKVVTFLFADHGLDLYSNGIGAKESHLKEHPDVVKGFVKATLRGYQYAFQHKEEAAQIIQKYAKALNNDITVEELKIVEDLTVTPDAKKRDRLFHGRMKTSLTGWRKTAASRRKKRRNRRTSMPPVSCRQNRSCRRDRH